MRANQDKHIVAEEWPVGEIFTDIATKLKIQKHLNDINDTITDDDIRNIRLFDPAVAMNEGLIQDNKRF